MRACTTFPRKPLRRVWRRWPFPTTKTTRSLTRRAKSRTTRTRGTSSKTRMVSSRTRWRTGLVRLRERQQNTMMTTNPTMTTMTIAKTTRHQLRAMPPPLPPPLPPPCLLRPLGRANVVRLLQPKKAPSPMLHTDEPTYSDTRLAQFEKAISPMEVTESGIATVGIIVDANALGPRVRRLDGSSNRARLVHPANALAEIEVRSDRGGITKEVRLEHPSNADSPIVVRKLATEKLADARAVQPWKAEVPMLTRAAPKSTDASAVDVKKAESPIVLTESGNSTDVTLVLAKPLAWMSRTESANHTARNAEAPWNPPAVVTGIEKPTETTIWQPSYEYPLSALMLMCPLASMGHAGLHIAVVREGTSAVAATANTIFFALRSHIIIMMH
mmetsp:Transcript_16823/g.49546  ORF Transcript_16823/g.49546 Transcript_16823/m.49546 type:complete len:386 (-) Transcript_16823:53-1210(-)